MTNNDYFSLEEIRKRVHRQQRQQLIRTLNIAATVTIGMVAIAIVQGSFPLPFRSFAEQEMAIPPLIAILVFFVGLFVALLVHRIWLNGQMKIDAEIDQEMRAQRIAKHDREGGGLFYDDDEEALEYDLKPKRKLKER
jgi:hypothetical protein